MFVDLAEEVRRLSEDSPRGEPNQEKESEEEERKRKAREAFVRGAQARKVAKAKQAKALQRQLSVNRRTKRMAKSRSTKALKTHANITPTPKAKPSKPLTTGMNMFGDLVEEVRWLFEGAPSRKRKPDRQKAAGISSADRAALGTGQMPIQSRGPRDRLKDREQSVIMKKRGAAKYKALLHRH